MVCRLIRVYPPPVTGSSLVATGTYASLDRRLSAPRYAKTRQPEPTFILPREGDTRMHEPSLRRVSRRHRPTRLRYTGDRICSAAMAAAGLAGLVLFAFYVWHMPPPW